MIEGLTGVLYIIFGLLGTVGTFYAVYLGIRVAAATDSGKRKQALDRIKKTLASLFIVIILTGVLMAMDLSGIVKPEVPNYENGTGGGNLTTADGTTGSNPGTGGGGTGGGGITIIDPPPPPTVTTSRAGFTHYPVAGMTGFRKENTRFFGALRDTGSTIEPIPADWKTVERLKNDMRDSRTPTSADFAKKWRRHTGVDLAWGSIGTVFAAKSGTVSMVGNDSGGYGRYIEINHGNGYFSFYAHLKDGSIRVSKGQGVQGGQPIATVGHTGNADGPNGDKDNHLHFEVRKASGASAKTAMATSSSMWFNPNWLPNSLLRIQHDPSYHFSGAVSPS